MLHNFSPANFSLVHGSQRMKLKPSIIGDSCLSDESFFSDMQSAAKRYFTDLRASAALQDDMMARLKNLRFGGWITASN